MFELYSFNDKELNFSNQGILNIYDFSIFSWKHYFKTDKLLRYYYLYNEHRGIYHRLNFSQVFCRKKHYKDMYIQLVFLYIPIYAWCLFANDFWILLQGFLIDINMENNNDVNTVNSAVHFFSSTGWSWLITFQRQLLSYSHRLLFRHVWLKYNCIHFHSTCNPWLSKWYYCKSKTI